MHTLYLLAYPKAPRFAGEGQVDGAAVKHMAGQKCNLLLRRKFQRSF